MTYLLSFTIVMVFLLIGEWVSAATKAYVPSIFITAVLFAIGFWTIVPKNIVTQASYTPQFVGVAMSLLLVQMGSLMNLKELLNQWKAVCIALLGICGTLLFTLIIGSFFFNWKTVIAAVPPLTGGIVAALLMTNGLKAAGITSLVALPVSMFIMHSMIGYPLTAVLLRKEGKRLSVIYNQGKDDPNSEVTKVIQQHKNAETTEKSLLKLPDRYQTPIFIIARVAIVALLANWIGLLLHGAINANVICLILGVIAHQIGFIETNALDKAKIFNWLMYGLLAYIFSQLSLTTPAIIGHIIIQIVALILLGILGMFIASFLLAKPFGFSREMAFACSLTALFGFPADFILTTEICHTVAQNENEEIYLTENMLPKMLVGGFATVSVASVIIASIFLKLL
ncbi:hypothetical protein [Companilactobacillus crustorum]|uniref:hypothetical protein n=1 Tax=Companilactobacillus crustorum TaxID=392416 RepID=UPI0009579E99|nr:hypothetical protein [Companilactobacillus crustorum]APU71089.1 hypothetical protein BI355_0767 [Companilactobacillus crustorum]WDT64668.1 hypothetical protein NV391_06610 [Companilactobacillus crustorum]HCD07312.1 hypothetical protein [Lactobacillus sp.]